MVKNRIEKDISRVIKEGIDGVKNGKNGIESGSVIVGGEGAITIGDNNNVTNIITPRFVNKVRPVIDPGDGCINENQAARLKDKVSEIIELEKLVKQKPASYGKVWTSLNKRMGVSAYRMIAEEDFPRAMKFLSSWIGRLSSTKTAKKKDGKWRNRKYAYIKLNIKQMGRESELDLYLDRNFGVDSLSLLTDEELEKTYNTVAYWKRKRK